MKAVFLAVWLVIPRVAQPAGPHIKSAVAAYDAGDASAKNNQVAEAIQHFREAIEIEPTYREAFERLIDVCLVSGRRAEAALAMTQLLEIEPNLNRFRLLLGQILLEQGQTERGLAQFSLVLRSDPANPDALAGFAAAAAKLGMADRAAEALERGRNQYPTDARFKTDRSSAR
jgi:tetratricopeptide (TPR) repeat protein